MQHWRRRLTLVGLACAMAAGGAANAQRAETGALPRTQPEALLADASVDGVSLGEWTARWWRWAHGQWVAPYLDPDGRLCEVGQGGPVWFLAGTDGSFNPSRACVVPEGRHLLLPVINMLQRQGRVPRTCAELQADAAVNNDQLSSAVVLLNDRPLGDMRLHRVRSDGCFRMDPDDAASPLMAADGYWLMLQPLPRGRHTLVVAANYGDTGTGYGGMRQNFEYVLDVGSSVLISVVDRPR